MNWFERHLNWTAFIITFCGLIFTFIVALFAMGFNIGNRPYLLEFEFKIYLTLVVFFATLVSVIGIAWVIKKKQCKRALLLFFISSLFFSPILFLLLIHRETYFEVGIIFGIGFISFIVLMGFWITGLILLFFKQGQLKDNEIAEKVSIRPSSNYKRYTRPFTLFLFVTIIISITSFLRINSGYQLFTYESYVDEELHFSKFTFECHKSYYEDWTGDIIYYPGEEISLIRHRMKPFTLESTEIQINISSSVIEEGNPVYPSLVEQVIYFYFHSRYGQLADYIDINIKDLAITKTEVNGIPAEYATFLTDDSNTLYPTEGEVKLVCFNRAGIIWTICMKKLDEKTISPNPDFDHILQTFRIF